MRCRATVTRRWPPASTATSRSPSTFACFLSRWPQPSREMRRKNSPAPESTNTVELEGRLAEAHAAVLAHDEAHQRAERELPAGKPRAQAGWVAAASAAWLIVALALLSPPAFLRGAVARPF